MPGGLGNGADMDVLRALNGKLAGKFTWHNLNAQTQQYLATDSVNMTASMHHMMATNVGLRSTTIAGNEFAFIDPVVTGSLDSIQNGHFVRVGKLHSTQLNWNKAVPNEIELAPGNTPWNVGTIPLSLYDNWTRNIYLTNGSKSGLPGVTAADDNFMDHLRVPVAPEKSTAKFAFISDQDMQFADYNPDSSTPPSFFRHFRIDATNVDIITELPPGKECYDWQIHGAKSKTHITQPVKQFGSAGNTSLKK